MPPPPLFQRLFSLEGKSVLVTGASGGIGRVLAAVFAEAGGKVGIHGTAASRLEEARRLVERVGAPPAVLPADLRTVEGARDLVARASAALGGLDVLVNCVGMNRRKPISLVTEEDYDAIQAVNLRSVFFSSQAAHPILKSRGGGKIIHFGSMASTLGLSQVSVYGLTKAAIVQMTKTMAVEWARDGIQVNCILPGFLRTPLTEEYFWQDESRRRWLLERIPAGRGGTPEDLAGAALLLASPASSYLTGQAIAVDGGFLAGGSWERDDVPE
jgi:NAD(P)-dependent dehydrogenase (short-subunit alcohol dehydrogenase family)